MADLEIYEIDSAYIEYLSAFEEHLFRNKKVTQDFSRKYIGIILEIEGFKYFAPPFHLLNPNTNDFAKLTILSRLVSMPLSI